MLLISNRPLCTAKPIVTLLRYNVFMRNETRLILELFVEKADILETRNFYRLVAKNGISLNIKWTAGQAMEARAISPDSEALAALIVTFRMFIQRNDRISISRLGDLLVDPSLSEDWKAQFCDVRDKVNQGLDKAYPISIMVNGLTPTAREIMDVFIYGDIAHTNELKRQTFLKWKQIPVAFSLLHHVFLEIMMNMLEKIHYINGITKLELAGKPVPRLPTNEEQAEMDAQRQAKEDAEQLERLNS